MFAFLLNFLMLYSKCSIFVLKILDFAATGEIRTQDEARSAMLNSAKTSAQLLLELLGMPAGLIPVRFPTKKRCFSTKTR